MVPQYAESGVRYISFTAIPRNPSTDSSCSPNFQTTRRPSIVENPKGHSTLSVYETFLVGDTSEVRQLTKIRNNRPYVKPILGESVIDIEKAFRHALDVASFAATLGEIPREGVPCPEWRIDYTTERFSLPPQRKGEHVKNLRNVFTVRTLGVLSGAIKAGQDRKHPRSCANLTRQAFLGSARPEFRLHRK